MAATKNRRLSEVAEEYVKIRKGQRSPGQVYQDQKVLQAFKRHTGDRVLTNITPEHVEDWFYGDNGLRNEHKVTSTRGAVMPGISEQTHNHYRIRLAMFFKWCYARGYVKRGDLMERVQPLKVPKKKRLRPNPETLLRMLDGTKSTRDRAYMATLINTALRGKEARLFKVEDIDLADGWASATITKTGEVDDIPITNELDRELRKWLVEYAESLGRPLQHDDYLFPGRYGGMISHYETSEDGTRYPVRHELLHNPSIPIRSEQASDIVKDGLRHVGLPTKGEGTHTIRRAVALAYFEYVSQDRGDVSALRETSALLHHANTSTTERYLGITPEKKRRDRRMRGQDFMVKMAQTGDNVVPLKAVGRGE